MPTIFATICHIVSGQKLLLLRKSKGLFGEGKWNAPGGKLRPNEDPEECAIREVLEETGLIVQEIKQDGILKFYFGAKDAPDWIVYVFSTRSFRGSANPGAEGELRWFSMNEIPYQEMWDDDKFWLPLVIQEKRFRGVFHFDEKAHHLLGHKLIEI